MLLLSSNSFFTSWEAAFLGLGGSLAMLLGFWLAGYGLFWAGGHRPPLSSLPLIDIFLQTLLGWLLSVMVFAGIQTKGVSILPLMSVPLLLAWLGSRYGVRHTAPFPPDKSFSPFHAAGLVAIAALVLFTHLSFQGLVTASQLPSSHHGDYMKYALDAYSHAQSGIETLVESGGPILKPSAFIPFPYGHFHIWNYALFHQITGLPPILASNLAYPLMTGILACVGLLALAVEMGLKTPLKLAWLLGLFLLPPLSAWGNFLDIPFLNWLLKSPLGFFSGMIAYKFWGPLLLLIGASLWMLRGQSLVAMVSLICAVFMQPQGIFLAAASGILFVAFTFWKRQWRQLSWGVGIAVIAGLLYIGFYQLTGYLDNSFKVDISYPSLLTMRNIIGRTSLTIGLLMAPEVLLLFVWARWRGLPLKSLLIGFALLSGWVLLACLVWIAVIPRAGLDSSQIAVLASYGLPILLIGLALVAYQQTGGNKGRQLPNGVNRIVLPVMILLWLLPPYLHHFTPPHRQAEVSPAFVEAAAKLPIQNPVGGVLDMDRSRLDDRHPGVRIIPSKVLPAELNWLPQYPAVVSLSEPWVNYAGIGDRAPALKRSHLQYVFFQKLPPRLQEQPVRSTCLMIAHYGIEWIVMPKQTELPVNWEVAVRKHLTDSRSGIQLVWLAPEKMPCSTTLKRLELATPKQR